ncbi:FkbM family methyltransferase [Candidatus Parcubacteria bacterium]|nr:MAG: FkbM family methyltransferase [Candidatus Parcubacteria bacterium]
MQLFNHLFPDKKLAVPSGVLPRRLSLLDIGARGGVQWPWDRVNRELLSLVLVEPDPVEAERIRKELGTNEGAVIPSVLWRDERILTLNLNRSPGTSSVYLPNRQFLDQFPEAERYDVLEQLEMPAKTIDVLSSSGQMPQVDFAKIDAQGAELAILEGGRNLLAANLVGLEVEVEFAELYYGQPLFCEVETFVREQIGLELWDLRKTYWKYEQGKTAPGPIKGRLVFGDALFLRPLSGMEAWLAAMSPDAAKEKLIMLMVTTLAYGYFDYTAFLLSAPSLDRYLDLPVRQGLQRALLRGGGFRPFRYGNGPLFVILDALARAVQPTYAGWASISRGLGSRRRGPFWF